MSIAATIRSIDGAPHHRDVAQAAFMIGSDPSCELAITSDPQIAPRHLEVTVRPWDLAVIVHPLEATSINHATVAGPTMVTAVDVITIGRTQLQLRALGEPTRRRWWNPRHWSSVVTSPAPPIAQPARMLVPPTANPPAPRLPPPIIANPPPPMVMVEPLTPPLHPTEVELLGAVERTPADAGARLVYADWLEEQGLADHAAFVRDQPGFVVDMAFREATSVAWRAITSRGEILCCDAMPACASRWDTLVATDNPRVRSCDTCNRVVEYCHDPSDVARASRRNALIVVDVELARADALEAYQRWRPIE